MSREEAFWPPESAGADRRQKKSGASDLPPDFPRRFIHTNEHPAVPNGRSAQKAGRCGAGLGRGVPPVTRLRRRALYAYPSKEQGPADATGMEAACWTVSCRASGSST
jgi:hypothetical protein